MTLQSTRFNTVNGKYYSFITFVLPSLRSGTCNVWVSSSLCSSATSHSAAHTINGKCCRNQKYFRNDILSTSSFNTVNGKYYSFITFVLPSLRSGTCNVWTSSLLCSSAASHSAAHTINGRCCCNFLA